MRRSRFKEVLCITVPFFEGLRSGTAGLLEDIGRMIDKLYTVCLVVLAIILALVIIWVISTLFRGRARG